MGEVARRAGEGYFLIGNKCMLLKFKKSLRFNQSDAENILWYRLRNRNLNGFKFRRQHVLHGYIVDFVCLEEKFMMKKDRSY